MRKIATYDTRTFTDKFMPAPELVALMKGDISRFLILRVEDMYKHVRQAVPPSRSQAHICLYLTSGEGNMKIGSESYTIRKGQLLFVPAGQVFSFGEKDVNKGYILFFHNFPGRQKYAFEFLQVWGNPRIQLDAQTDRFALHIFKRLLLEYSTNGQANAALLQSYSITLLHEVNRLYDPVNFKGQPAAIQLTRSFRELLFTHIREKQRVTDYATLLNISPNHLNKSVKAVSGKSPNRWIDETIMLEAKVLLSQSSFSVSEVAMELGMEDASYFTRLFRKYEGLTPTEYRKMIEKS